MLLNINEICVVSINYFIVSIYKVFILYLYTLSTLILYISSIPNQSFNPEIGGPCPLTPSIYYTGGFSNRIQKSQKNFDFFCKK